MSKVQKCLNLTKNLSKGHIAVYISQVCIGLSVEMGDAASGG